MYCDKCEKELQEVDGEIQGGKCLKFKDGEYEYFVIRCDECFSKDTSLSNYKKTEVYSRVVGYMRPVTQWHKGKQEEYKHRKVFKNMTDETPNVPVEETPEVEETPVETPAE